MGVASTYPVGETRSEPVTFLVGRMALAGRRSSRPDMEGPRLPLKGRAQVADRSR